MKKNAADDPMRAALARDDPAAIELIWDRYAGALLAFLQAAICSKHDAEDVLQAVFVRLARKRRWLAKARSLDAYVFQVARNEAISYRRKEKRWKRPEAESDRWLENRTTDDRDLAEQLQTVLGKLAPAQREVVVLKVYKSMTFNEIGQCLGISLNTAASRYRYAMDRLSDLLKDDLL